MPFLVFMHKGKKEGEDAADLKLNIKQKIANWNRYNLRVSSKHLDLGYGVGFSSGAETATIFQAVRT